MPLLFCYVLNISVEVNSVLNCNYSKEDKQFSDIVLIKNIFEVKLKKEKIIILFYLLENKEEIQMK